MTDKEKIKKIEEILSGGNTAKVLENAAKSIKEELNFVVEFNADGTIKHYWYKEKPTRAKKVKKETKPEATTEPAKETKPEEKKKK